MKPIVPASTTHEMWCARTLTGGADACDCFGADLSLAPSAPRIYPTNYFYLEPPSREPGTYNRPPIRGDWT